MDHSDFSQILPKQKIIIANSTRIFEFITPAYMTVLFNIISTSEYYSEHPGRIYDFFRSRLFGLKEQTVSTLIDSIAHFLIASLTWAFIARPILVNPFAEIFCTGLISSLIDLDCLFHRFTAAIKSTQSRVFLHDSFTLLVLNVTVWWVSCQIYGEYQASRVALMFLVAWYTHLAKDAHRSGFWCIWFQSAPIGIYFSFRIVYVIAILIQIFIC